MENKNLPTINDLYANLEVSEKDNALAVILNNEPHRDWIKEHPITHERYLPIGIVEYLLTRIFIKWRVEILQAQLIGNSVTVTVRLHYINPVSGEWECTDGIGASPLQTAQGAGAIDFNQIKSAAVSMAAPAAESYAIKDAAEKLGKVFGKDLNRKHVANYYSLADKFNNTAVALPTSEITSKLTAATTQEDLGILWDSLNEEEQKDAEVKRLFTKRKLELV